MKRKLLSIIMVSFVALQVVACGDADVAGAEVPVMETIDAAEVAPQTEETPEAEAAPEAEQAQAPAADQASDFEGQYYAGDGNLSILKQEDGSYLIEVWWGINAAQHGEWVMHGQYDGTDTITYSDCVKHELTLNESGEVDADDTIYEAGTGSIKIVDASTIMWNDDMEHIADDVPMTR